MISANKHGFSQGRGGYIKILEKVISFFKSAPVKICFFPIKILFLNIFSDFTEPLWQGGIPSGKAISCFLKLFIYAYFFYIFCSILMPHQAHVAPIRASGSHPPIA